MDAASWHYDEVCGRIVDSELHDDILSYLSWVTLDVASCSQSNTKRQVVERLVSILHHVVTWYFSDDARDNFSKRAHIVGILHKLRDVNDWPVGKG